MNADTGLSRGEELLCFALGAAAGLASAMAVLIHLSSGEWPSYARPFMRVVQMAAGWLA